jgi:hypothetical protein
VVYHLISIRSPQGYLKSKNSLSASAKSGLFWFAPNRRAVYSKALRTSRCFSLLCLFLEVTKVLRSHQARSQRGSRGRQQVIVEVRKVELSSGATGAEYIAGRRQKSETSAFTSQSEISRMSALSFLWCSFRVRRIAFIS